jgi:hypothetical protein
MGLDTMAIREHEALRLVGRYEIVRELGRGATAVVYLARQSDLDRLVALKELAGLHAADPAFIERFLRESRLAGSLNHPNVVTVHEYFEHDGVPFIAMEFFERGSLRCVLPTLTLAQTMGVLEGLLGGLSHAEKRGVVHRDLKPENVMVTSSGGVKISDFGIAKALAVEASHRLTLTGSTVGTPAYMAPEQALAREVGPWTDLYAVGVLAYEMLAGDVPFTGSDVPMAIMLQHVSDPVPSLASVRPDLDPTLSRWVERMLAKAAGERPQSAADAWEDLDEIAIRVLGPRWRREMRLTESPRVPVGPSAPATASTIGAAATRRRRFSRRLQLGGAVAVVAVAVVAGAATAVSLGDEGSPNEAPPPKTTVERTTRTTSAPEPVSGPVLDRVQLAERQDGLAITLRLGRARLAPGAVHVLDRDLADGVASFVLRGEGIGSKTRGRDLGPVALRVRRGAGRLLVNVSAEPRAFTAFSARRIDGSSVVITLTEPEPEPVAPRTDSGTSSGSDVPVETTPTTPPPDDEPKKPPPVKTG